MFKGDPSEACRKRYEQKLDRINALESYMKGLSDEQLRGKTEELRGRVMKNAGEGDGPVDQKAVFTDDIVCEAFALVREGALRAIGLRPFDCQVIGGLVLHEGEIAEMGTGEGKTLVSVAPAFLNALCGRGVHVVTVNDYLARRDAEWVGRVHTFLGLQVGLVQSGGAGLVGGQIAQAAEGESVDPEIKRQAYRADITYVTNSELGFDFLRDNLAATKEELVLRDNNPYYCIIDEVDSILIDEARTPLIISGQAEQPSDKYVKSYQIAKALVNDTHYTVEEKRQTVLLTEEGYEAVESVLQVSDLYDPREQWISFVSNAIKAKELQKKDVNYIVKGGEIVIIDEFTGRTMQGRRWGEGLHQAIEAKEGVEIQPETVTLASVSYQSLFRMYPKASGMTGTASTEAEEFGKTYNLPVKVLPPNRESARKDNPDVVFSREGAKWRAVAAEVSRMHQTGRPVLVGTTSVEQSENLSQLLEEAGISHSILNAKPQFAGREAQIIAQSGRLGAVTISTNMAGRGTDILLGGNPGAVARLKLREAVGGLLKQSAAVEAGDALGAAAQAQKNKAGAPDPAGLQAEEEAPKEVGDSSLFPCEPSAEAAEKLASAASDLAARTQPLVETAQSGDTYFEKSPDDAAAIAVADVDASRGGENALAWSALEALEGEYRAALQSEREEVVALGGLHVVGTERHESRRVDNQLRGRCGRQGDPGSTRFFLSLEDRIFRVFGGDRIEQMMKAFQVEDLPIESGLLTSALDEAQKKVEQYFYDIRKQLFDYDNVVNSQRERVYAERRGALGLDDMADQMEEYARLTVNDVLEANVDPLAPPEEWALDALAEKMVQYCYLLEGQATGESLGAYRGDYEGLRAFLQEQCVQAYQVKSEEIEAVKEGLTDELQRYIVLSQFDRLWREHLESIKFLQQAVGLRGYAQKDPLTEFKLEAYNIFLEMMAQVRRNCIYAVYQVDAQQLASQMKRQDSEDGAAVPAVAAEK